LILVACVLVASAGAQTIPVYKQLPSSGKSATTQPTPASPNPPATAPAQPAPNSGQAPNPTPVPAEKLPEQTPTLGQAAGLLSGQPELVAARLQHTTVTVRISAAVGPVPAQPQVEQGITVVSGISLGRGWIVTYATLPESPQIRVTLPRDGSSLEAKLRVTDQFSGLSLIHVPQPQLVGLELTAETPAVGSPLFTAAGSGIEDPVVSFGMLAAVDRSQSALLAPLLQCDLRATSSSSGAAVVDARGRLVGIIASTDAPNQRSGWTYAIPARYVRRLMENRPAQELDPPVVLQRRRPVLGLTLRTSEENNVKVERVAADGPAARAGVRDGDVILECDGIKIRSAYQAVNQALRKEPGDQMSFVIQRGTERIPTQLTLGGGGPLPMQLATTGPDNTGKGSTRVVPVGPRQVGVIELQIPPLEAGPTNPGQAADASPPKLDPLVEVQLLRRQIQAWATVIETFQRELRARDDMIRQLREALDGRNGPPSEKK